MTKLIEIVSSLHNIWPTNPHGEVKYITQDDDGLIAYWGGGEPPFFRSEGGEWLGPECLDTLDCFAIADGYSEAIVTLDDFIEFKEVRLAVMKGQHGASPVSTLRYKVGDEVVLGVNVDVNTLRGIAPGAIVKITDVHECSEPPHYTVRHGNNLHWWIEDKEINHEVTEMWSKYKPTQEPVQTLSENAPVLSFLSRITVMSEEAVGVVGDAQEESKYTHISLDKDSLTGDNLLVLEQGGEYSEGVIYFTVKEAEAVIKAMQTLMGGV